MVDDKDPAASLPVLGQPTGDDQSPAPMVYVTLEEKVILDAMRRLRAEAEEVRARLAEATAPEARGQLEEELEELRRQRADLAQRREAAYRRKMVMLGHMDEE
jgi:hypothetical protein